MIRLIVVIFVLLEYAAEKHRAGYHYHVCCGNDHDNGDKEEKKCCNGAFYRCRDIVGDRKHDYAERADEPVALWRTFAVVFASHERYGAVFSDLPERIEVYEQEYRAEDAYRHYDADGGHRKVIGHVSVHDAHEPQLGEL